MSGDGERPRTRWAAVALLIVVGIAAAMQFSKIAAIFLPVAEAYAASDAAAALFMSAPAIVGMVLGVTASVFAARIGFRRVIIGCLALGAVLSLAQSLLPPVPVFLTLRVIEGVAHLGLVIACPVLIILLSAPRQVALTMSVWGTFFGLGFAIAGWLAPMIEARGGVGAVFVAHGILLAALLIAVLLLLPRIDGDGPQPSAHTDGFLRAHLEAYRNPRAVLPGLVFVFHTAMYVSLITFVPLFADPGTATALLIWMPLVSIVGTVAAGFFAQYATTPPIVLLVGYAGVAALIVVVWSALAGGVPILAAPLVMMFFSGLIQGGTFGLIPALSTDPTVTSRASGVLTQLGNVGSTFGPPVFASVIVGTGASAFVPIVWLVVGLCAGGAIVSAIALRFTGGRARGPRGAKDLREPAPQ